MTRSRALHDEIERGLVSAAITFSTCASITGSVMPPTFGDPFVLATREVKKARSVFPSVPEKPNR
jgi:hypothetical protein